MELVLWDLSDKFNYTQLQGNWIKVDDHDHTPGKGLLIPAGGLAPNAVLTPNLINEAVTTGKIAVGAVTADRIGDGEVTTPKLVDGAVNFAKTGTGTGGLAQYAFRFYRNANENQARGNGPNFNAKNFDYRAVAANVFEFRAPVAGIYYFYWRMQINNQINGNYWWRSSLNLNGGAAAQGTPVNIYTGEQFSDTSSVGATALGLAANDLVSVGYNAGDTTAWTIGGGSDTTYFGGFLVGRT